MKRDRTIAVGAIIAIAIAVAAPFVASSNPDGLESAFFGIFGPRISMARSSTRRLPRLPRSR